MNEEIKRLLAIEPETAQILDAFRAIDSVYQESLWAMGQSYSAPPETGSTAQFVLSAEQTQSTKHPSTVR